MPDGKPEQPGQLWILHPHVRLVSLAVSRSAAGNCTGDPFPSRAHPSTPLPASRPGAHPGRTGPINPGIGLEKNGRPAFVARGLPENPGRILDQDPRHRTGERSDLDQRTSLRQYPDRRSTARLVFPSTNPFRISGGSGRLPGTNRTDPARGRLRVQPLPRPPL